MPFDGFVLAAVAAELKDKILAGKIVKIYQPEKNLIILRVRKGDHNFQLLISAHPATGRIHLTSQTRENPTQAPLFCMVLRKHLEGGRICAIEQNNLDRVLLIHIEAFDEIGRQAKKILMVEIMGKHSNIVLVDPKDNTILDGIRRYTHLVSRHREVLPGREYLAPPAQNKVDSLQVNEETFRSTLLSLPLNGKIAPAIVQNFSGFSPLLAAEVVARAQLPEDTLLDDLGDYELIRLWQAAEEIIGAAKNSHFVPTVAKRLGHGADFSCIRLLQFDFDDLETFPTISEALDYFFSARQQEELFSARQRELLKIVHNEGEKIQKKLALQREKLHEVEDMEKMRLWGELITAQMHRLSKGMAEAELDNFYHPDVTVKVALNPVFTPAENAQFYFKKYRKAKASRAVIEEQIRKNQEDLDYLNSVISSLEQATDLQDLEEIKGELVDTGYLREKPQPGKKKSGVSLLPPLSFTSRDGYTIMVGKNNRQNDLLTLKMAQKEDLWLHTKNIPGSHVIIRRKPGREIPFSTIEEAARLAAFYSKGRYSSRVPVDYTPVREVKKPHGAKPGMVIYFAQKTLYVTPPPEIEHTPPGAS